MTLLFLSKASGLFLAHLPPQRWLCTYRAFTDCGKHARISSAERKGKCCFSTVTGWRSSSFQTNWCGRHGQRLTPETYTSRGRLDRLHHSLSNLKPHRFCCFQEVVFYYRTSRSWHFWSNCFRSKSIPSHTLVLTQPVTQMYSWRELRSEHAILTDTPARLCQSTGRKLTGIQMSGDNEG